GAPPETLWAYDTSKFAEKPPAAAYAAAGQYVVKDDIKLNGLQDIKDNLDKKNPVVFGIRVYDSFMKSKGGIIPTPNPKTEKLLGGHAVCAVGYDDTKGVLIMRNSWGTTWGDKGYFYLPYSYFKLNLVADAHASSGAVLRIGK
ncbi:MAG: C1 family peptidase, partial [Candidatus Sericytochromatia bacterium]|nr:C1 family peptidase [Candidatus Sericytochromatia bacterium]